MKKHEEFFLFLNKKLKINPTRIKLDSLVIEEVRELYRNESAEQMALMHFQDVGTIEIHTLNLLEEFSLKVFHNKTISHEALMSVKTPFVEIVEKHAIILLHTREVAYGVPTYANILKLYEVWKDQVEREPMENRITETWREIFSDSTNIKLSMHE
jgi:hypothetical protein